MARQRREGRIAFAAGATATAAAVDDFEVESPSGSNRGQSGSVQSVMASNGNRTVARRGRPEVVPNRGRARQRIRARKVRRIVRHVDPWSVLKLSLLFYFCMFLILMVAGVILWSIAAHAGLIARFENFLGDAQVLQNYHFQSSVMLRAATVIGLVLVVTATGINVLAAVLFNLISDLVGGVRLTVLEEDPVIVLTPNLGSTDATVPLSVPADRTAPVAVVPAAGPVVGAPVAAATDTEAPMGDRAVVPPAPAEMPPVATPMPPAPAPVIGA